MYRKPVGRCVFAFVLLLRATDLPAQELPAPFEAEYEGAKFPFSARATIALQRIGDYYRYSMRGSVRAAFFKWTEVYDCSILRIEGERFYPVEYVHRDSRDRQRNVHTRFDWSLRTLRTTRGGGAVEEKMELPPVAWDLMSIQVRLRADIAHADRGAELSYQVIEKDQVKRRRLKIDGVEEMQFDQHVLHVMKAETEDGKHRHQFWFAKNYAWLPVRVGIGGVTLDLVSPPAEAARAAAPPTDSPPSCR